MRRRQRQQQPAGAVGFGGPVTVTVARLLGGELDGERVLIRVPSRQIQAWRCEGCGAVHTSRSLRIGDWGRDAPESATAYVLVECGMPLVEGEMRPNAVAVALYRHEQLGAEVTRREAETWRHGRRG